MDSNEMNFFNEHSFTREQFREHYCFKQQKKIDDKMMDPESYCKIKMLLLQNSKSILSKGAMKPANEFDCTNTKCQNGWFNNPPPTDIISGAF